VTSPATLPDVFFARLAELGSRHATHPEIFLDVWNAESGLNPRAENPATHARGLNQMMPQTLSGLGAPADFNALAGEDQLPWIECLIIGGERLNAGPFRSAARYYHSNFFPRTMARGSSPGAVVAARDAADPQERAAYAANAAALDPAGKGRITYADLAAFLNLAKNRNRLTYDVARARLKLAQRGSSPAAALRRAAPILVGVGLVAAVALWSAR
jgi:hypothetical protein